MTDYAARQRALFEAAGADAVALVPGPNMVYFTGLHFHLSERPVIALLTAAGLSIIIPRLETAKLDARPDLNARPFAWTDEAGYVGAFEAALDTLNLRGKTLAVDGMTMRVTEWLTFQQIDPTLRVQPAERAMIGLRARKLPAEIDAMRRAVQISETALGRVLADVAPGMTEKAVAARLAAVQTELGAAGLSFAPLVQSGPNSANPHGASSDRVIEDGDLLLIDFGCLVDGYPSDITRTVVIGTPSDEIRRIHETVARANAAARAVVRPGVPMRDVDKAARDVIDAAGYGDYFIHRTGHGLGLDVHEPIPQIAANVDDLLEAGMTFTIEPGIYIAGLGGVRIEDNVVVTEDGVEVLTSYPREL